MMLLPDFILLLSSHVPVVELLQPFVSKALQVVLKVLMKPLNFMITLKKSKTESIYARKKVRNRDGEPGNDAIACAHVLVQM